MVTPRGKDLILESVHFSEEGVQLVYVDAADLKDVAGGPVTMTRTLILARNHENYPELETAYDDLIDIVREISSDHEHAQAWAPDLGADEDDEDEEGMGS